jgi:hypothetical protein
MPLKNDEPRAARRAGRLTQLPDRPPTTLRSQRFTEQKGDVRWRGDREGDQKGGGHRGDHPGRETGLGGRGHPSLSGPNPVGRCGGHTGEDRTWRRAGRLRQVERLSGPQQLGQPLDPGGRSQRQTGPRTQLGRSDGLAEERGQRRWGALGGGLERPPWRGARGHRCPQDVQDLGDGFLQLPSSPGRAIGPRQVGEQPAKLARRVPLQGGTCASRETGGQHRPGGVMVPGGASASRGSGERAGPASAPTGTQGSRAA